MSCAAAIFVKTPGRSPVKTRLAASIGRPLAERLHLAGAEAVAAVLRTRAATLQACFAIAEHDTGACWPGLPTVWQGPGGLGARLHRVFAHLQARHGAALLLGADTPQLTPALIDEATALLAEDAPRIVFGPAGDGGFWLFGANRPVPARAWHAVRYSRSDTGAMLLSALDGVAPVAQLALLHDIDTAADLAVVAAALAALPARLPAQDAVLALLREALAGGGAAPPTPPSGPSADRSGGAVEGR